MMVYTWTVSSCIQLANICEKCVFLFADHLDSFGNLITNINQYFYLLSLKMLSQGLTLCSVGEG